MAHKYSRDPLYEWLIPEIQELFQFLVDEFGFRRRRPDVSGTGCLQEYSRANTRIQLWAEMGSRPECDIIRNGIRVSLDHLILELCSDRSATPRGEYSGLESSKRDFEMVLQNYAEVIRDFRGQIIPDSTD